MKILKTNPDTYHIYTGDPMASMLSRYGILAEDTAVPMDTFCEEAEAGVVLHTPMRDVTFALTEASAGYTLRIPLTEKERLFGGGDSNRKQLMLRGMKMEISVDDYTSYGPMPVLISDQGWAIFVNSTYIITLDCAKTETDAVIITVPKGNADFYLFRGDSMKALLFRLTAVIGRPALMPKFAYGLSFVENEQIDARGLLWDIQTLRERNIPCDVIGLEPNWMEKRYDYSTAKKWDPKTFWLPSWEPENQSGSFTFFYPMRKMGMNLSLWMCCDYDLFYAEDNDYQERKPQEKNITGDIKDVHLAMDIKTDQITDPKTPWFAHLKKFVDNGAAAFKLDGALQVLHHWDRLWGGKYLDEETHNVYPVLLAKQMSQGFRNYTDRRLFLYTAGAYAGTAQYAATWAGDTGGKADTVLSLLTHAMSGHSNTTCDLEVTENEAIHYGFLTAFAQYFCWANWKYPWFLGEKTEEMIRFYAQLRSSLVPYIYTMAHVAHETGIAVVRPLPLMYENTDRFDDVKNAYMLGDKLYVGVFDMDLKLPEGKWVDYWNGDVYEGDISYQIPEGRGGALFVKQGSVFVTMQPQRYVLEKEHDYIVQVYPGADDSFSLYEDDGYTYDFEQGNYCTTQIKMENSDASGFRLTVCKRQGSFAGRPDNGSQIAQNSIPKIDPCHPVRDMQIRIFGQKPAAITVNGTDLDFTYADNAACFLLPAGIHEAGDVVYQIFY